MSKLNPNANSFVPSFGVKTAPFSNDFNARVEEVVDIIEAACLQDDLKNNLQAVESKDNEELFNDDEEEFMQMLEMQEECRMEMMKYYIQAQNPELFEEVYFGVSYESEQIPSPANDVDAVQQMQCLTLNGNNTPAANTQVEAPVPIHSEIESLVNAIKTNLNTEAPEFIPKAFQ